MADGVFEAVRKSLAEQREVGIDFDSAWERAMYAALGDRGTAGAGLREFGLTENERHRIALEDCRAEWRAAYERIPTEAARAIAGMAMLDELSAALT